MSESAEEMCGVNFQTFVQWLDCNCQIIGHTVLACLDEIEVGWLSLTFWRPCNRHDSQFHSYRVKPMLMWFFFETSQPSNSLWRRSTATARIFVYEWPILATLCEDFDPIWNDLSIGWTIYIDTELLRNGNFPRRRRYQRSRILFGNALVWSAVLGFMPGRYGIGYIPTAVFGICLWGNSLLFLQQLLLPQLGHSLVVYFLEVPVFLFIDVKLVIWQPASANGIGCLESGGTPRRHLTVLVKILSRCPISDISELNWLLLIYIEIFLDEESPVVCIDLVKCCVRTLKWLFFCLFLGFVYLIHQLVLHLYLMHFSEFLDRVDILSYVLHLAMMDVRS